MGKKKGRRGMKKNTNKNNYKINKRNKTMKIGKKLNKHNKKKINKMISNYSSLNVNDELSEIERKRLEGQILTAINTAKLYKKDKLTFLVDLFSLAEQVAPDRFARRENEGRPEKDRLLVVDDTPFFRDLEKTYFESVGFRVTLANNGEEALELLKERPQYYNLVVSDIVMPIMDGYELVKNIKANSTLEHIPIIALTSFTEAESQEKALAAGFDGYAMKTNKETIIRAVDRFLVED
mgnify:CR=1 FL=1